MLFAVSYIWSCNNDEPTPTGIVMGYVTDVSSSDSLSNARVVLFDANTNQPATPVIITLEDGAYSFSLPGGSYYLRVSAQGYEEVPAPGVPGLAFTVTNGQTTQQDVEMKPLTATDLGWISGRISGEIAD